MAQIQVLKTPGMESKDGWVVYNQGSVKPAVAAFNYTVAKPKDGINGCLSITNDVASNFLLWQKITVRGGEIYTVDAAIKTGNIASFWAEITVSTVAPIEGANYAPNGTADLISGFSTWVSCGPNIDGTFSANACAGKKSFTVPGAAGSAVDVYFGLKIGSSAAPLPAPFQVLIDEIKMSRAANTGNNLLTVTSGTLQNTSITIPGNLRAIQLKSSLTISPYATFKIVTAANLEVTGQALITNTMKVVVTSESGIVKTYDIVTTAPNLVLESFTNHNASVVMYQNKMMELNGAGQINISNASNPLEGSLINIKSENIWLYFPDIKPSVFQEKYIGHLQVNGEAAVMDKNIRIDQYLLGTMIISHPPTYQALQVFNGENYSGATQSFGNYTYYRSAQLGAMDNTIKSFKLKKGYMATIAADEQGTGYSCVYVADKEDIIINKLPATLLNQVSFVRVIPWRWTTKKGWTNGRDGAQMLNATWQYDWDNASSSSLDIEYVPMRHGMTWNAYANINNKLKSTHSLGFNEPDRPDQSNITVAAAVAAWPELLRSGLRLGSPSPSDASAGLTWLYQFMDQCDALHYRIDFVTVHWYKGGQTARQFYDWLRAVHVRTKRPIWVTEWNNGANWTCCKPTFAQDAIAINEMTNMMDTASFVERYSLYEWVEDTRQMFHQWATTLTPAGVVYRDNISPMAFNAKKAYNTTGPIISAVNEREELYNNNIFPNPTENTLYFTDKIISASVHNLNGEMVIENTEMQNGKLDISRLAAGVYFVKLSDGKLYWVEKVFKR